jgi:hypothetical protein
MNTVIWLITAFEKGLLEDQDKIEDNIKILILMLVPPLAQHY